MKAILLALLLSGCSFTPEHECRVSSLVGEGRGGSLTQWIKGEGRMIRIVQAGKGCDDVHVEIDGISVQVGGPDA